MLRSISLLLVLALVFGASGVFAQTKKPSSPGKVPTAKDPSIIVIVYMRDANKNEVFARHANLAGLPRLRRGRTPEVLCCYEGPRAYLQTG